MNSSVNRRVVLPDWLATYIPPLLQLRYQASSYRSKLTWTHSVHEAPQPRYRRQHSSFELLLQLTTRQSTKIHPRCRRGLPHLFSHIQASCLDSKSNRSPDNPRRQTMWQHRSPNLYLSDFFTACTPRNLQRLSITHVVSAIQADLSKHFDRGILVMHVSIKDTPNADL